MQTHNARAWSQPRQTSHSRHGTRGEQARSRYNPAMKPTWIILAVETSGRTGSAVLAVGREVRAATTFQADRNHAVELLPSIDRMCDDCAVRPGDIDQVHISAGPGSFTGLRIAVTLARTMARAGGQRVIAVPTLAVLAQNALGSVPSPPRIAVLLDAKRGQVYAGAFDLHEGTYRATRSPHLADPREFLASLPQPRFVLGEGLHHHRAACAGVDHQPLPVSLWRPRAEVVLQLGYALAQEGHFANPATLTPIYLRLPEAEEAWSAGQALR